MIFMNVDIEPSCLVSNTCSFEARKGREKRAPGRGEDFSGRG
jgi:hypothetical protein